MTPVTSGTPCSQCRPDRCKPQTRYVGEIFDAKDLKALTVVLEDQSIRLEYFGVPKYPKAGRHELSGEEAVAASAGRAIEPRNLTKVGFAKIVIHFEGNTSWRLWCNGKVKKDIG